MVFSLFLLPCAGVCLPLGMVCEIHILGEVPPEPYRPSMALWGKRKTEYGDSRKEGTMSRCPENQNKGHFFDADGFCRFCLLWDPDAIFVKREVRDGVPAEVRQVQRPDSLD